MEVEPLGEPLSVIGFGNAVLQLTRGVPTHEEFFSTLQRAGVAESRPAGGGANTPSVTLEGYDASHDNSVTLDNVIIDGITASHITASYTDITLGPGDVNFTPSGTNVTVTNKVTGASSPNPCTDKWTTF